MLVLLAALIAQDLPLERDPWDGVAVGSWVKIKTTRPAATDEVKRTLTEIGSDFKRIQSEPPVPATDDDDGTTIRFQRFSLAFPGAGMKAKTRAIETLAGGIKARLVEYRPEGEDDGAVRWRVWYSEQVVGGIAKASGQSDQGDTREKWEQEMKAAEKLTIAGKTLACTRFEVSRMVKKEDRTELTYWLSADVPGQFVKSRTRTTSGKVTSEVAAEVVDFEKK